LRHFPTARLTAFCKTEIAALKTSLGARDAALAQAHEQLAHGRDRTRRADDELEAARERLRVAAQGSAREQQAAVARADERAQRDAVERQFRQWLCSHIACTHSRIHLYIDRLLGYRGINLSESISLGGAFSVFVHRQICEIFTLPFLCVLLVCLDGME
jgi:hypothetical protein